MNLSSFSSVAISAHVDAFFQSHLFFAAVHFWSGGGTRLPGSVGSTKFWRVAPNIIFWARIAQIAGSSTSFIESADWAEHWVHVFAAIVEILAPHKWFPVPRVLSSGGWSWITNPPITIPTLLYALAQSNFLIWTVNITEEALNVVSRTTVTCV